MSDEPNLPVSEPGRRARANRRARPRSLRIFGWTALLALLGGWVWATNGHLDYVTISPGRTSSVGERITVSGKPQYASQGKIFWDTVNLVDRPTPLEAFYGWLQGDIDVFKRRLILGDATPRESTVESRAEMDDAKLVARVVAARRLGFSTVGGGGKILEILKTAPAAAKLRVGDVIVTIGGTPVCLQGDVREGLVGKRPGDHVRLGVRSAGGAMRDVDVATIAAPAGERVRIGIVVGPDPKKPCDLPFQVSVDTSRVGGPSAGLAMTLAILDRLSPGDLTGGANVAVTGTINADGSVGEVGGVKQKTIAVHAAGAKLFIVPEGELKTASANAHGMAVVGVHTLDEALDALQKVGGEPLPKPQ